jgi:hypothetical protein
MVASKRVLKTSSRRDGKRRKTTIKLKTMLIETADGWPGRISMIFRWENMNFETTLCVGDETRDAAKMKMLI